VVVPFQRRLLDAALDGPGVSPFAPRGARATAFLDLHTFDDTDGRRPARCGLASTPATSSSATGPCATRACHTTTFRISDSLADGEWVPQFGRLRLAERMVPAAVSALDDDS